MPNTLFKSTFIFSVACSLWLLSLKTVAQQFTPYEIAQGYALRQDSVYFIFNASDYALNAEPERVVVTGSFRSWEHDMNSAKWQLKQKQGIWQLAVHNPAFEAVAPAAEFKFRINEGRWLDPPANAPNSTGQNLVFMKGRKPAALTAEICRPQTIWAWVTGTGVQRPLNISAYELTDARGRKIPLAGVMPNDSFKTLITPAEPLDIRRVYFLAIPSLKLKTVCRFDGWFRDIYSNKELGANVNEQAGTTSFALFAPRATGVKLYLYKNESDKTPYATHECTVDADGIWSIVLPGDLHGVWYDYTVHGFDDPGNFFYETNPRHISDPYARVSDDSFGKCRVWHKTKPASPLKNGIPPMERVVAYEAHVQDFTDGLPIANEYKGTFKGMTIGGLKNKQNKPIGIDHLSDLGINVLHLQPIQEFLHYPDEEWQAAFKNDPYMKEQGVNMENYQWGYRTSHAMAIESRYRIKGSEKGAQREQFRDLVQAYHDRGIAVIVDLVFNHTAENMDMQQFFFNMDAIDRQYFYRTKNLEHIGEYGNETKTENRPMMQRWIIDQCLMLIEEFGVDGFRIDLAGQTDKQTLELLKNRIGADKIVYGEPWIDSNDPEYENNPHWNWYKKDSPITFFQDDARNAFKGPVSNPANKRTDRGYAGGNTALREQVKRGLTCTFPEEKTPISGINYLDIHDNWALADQFAITDWDGRKGVDEDAVKIAATLLFTSLGPVVIHGGTEFLRSKGLAPLKEIVKKTARTTLYFHGKRDTYNLRLANRFLWENVGKSKKTKGTPCDYEGMHQFWRALIQFRLSEAGHIFRLSEKAPPDHYQWFEPSNPALLGYVVGGELAVFLNVDLDKAGSFEKIELPAGEWIMVADNTGVDFTNGLKGRPDAKLQGNRVLNISMKPQGVKIFVKRKA
jgi:pullulanase/glycogen debranching enzyme